ncbi:MAG: hypothetical protein U1D67_08915 [Dehalococcoidia bacterium]|nr:hypothetical protein [Dehalococcoidia bacterium]
MENLYDLANEVGVVVVAASRSGSTEVYRLVDGRMVLVEHLKSGRDLVTLTEGVPEYLTVRYTPPIPAVGIVREVAGSR